MDDNSRIRDRVRRPSLIDMLDAQGNAGERPEEMPAAEAVSPLPSPGDVYKAHARPSHREETTLYCLPSNALPRGIAWHAYDSVRFEPPAKPGGGPVLVVRFTGAEPLDVMIEGRNLNDLFFQLGQNRILWIRELPTGKDFKDDSMTVITRLTIQPVVFRPPE